MYIIQYTLYKYITSKNGPFAAQSLDEPDP